MDIAALQASPAADAAVSEIARYGLQQNVVELDAYGFTVIPPEKTAAAPGFVEHLRDAILRTHGARNDDPIDDYRTAELKAGFRNSWWLLEEDEVFVEAVLNPVALAIARWMCGQSAVMTGATWLLKGSNKAPGIGGKDDQTKPLTLHIDALAVPPPMCRYAHFCNTSWVLSDYSTEEDGPTVYVPGSHLFGRAPFLHEQDFTREDNPYRVVPLRAREGSLVVWHGATWHGALPRTTPGLRVTLALMWMRAYMKPIQDWRESDPDLLDRHPELPRLLGLEHIYPFKYEEEAGYTAALEVAGRDQFA